MKKLMFLTLMTFALAAASVQKASAGVVVGGSVAIAPGGCYSPGYYSSYGYPRPYYGYPGYYSGYYAAPAPVYGPAVVVRPPVFSFSFGYPAYGYYGHGYRGGYYSHGHGHYSHGHSGHGYHHR